MPHAKVPSDSHLSIRMLKEATHILNATAREYGRKKLRVDHTPYNSHRGRQVRVFFFQSSALGSSAQEKMQAEG